MTDLISTEYHGNSRADLPSANDLGICEGWRDASSEWIQADADTVELLRQRFVGHAERTPTHTDRELRFTRWGTPVPLVDRRELMSELGTSFGEVDELPADLPPGAYHLWTLDGTADTTLFVIPSRVERWPADDRWGIVMQVATALSTESPTMGDLHSISAVGNWMAARGGTVLGLSPVGDMVPLAPRQTSPYSPSSRRFLDPLLIHDPLHGVASTRPDEVDRDTEWEQRRAQLRRRWEELDLSDRQAVVSQTGSELASTSWSTGVAHAVFNMTCEVTGAPWTRWTDDLARPDSAALRTLAHAHLDHVAWWMWVDRLAETEFRTVRADLANQGVDLLGDLPVGVASDGFDAWWDRSVLAEGWSVGAPPDPFSPIGQNWGLPPMDPHLVRRTGYQAFREVIAANLGRAAGLRIDHVMGLFRTFWIPPGADPTHGTYVRTPGTELIDLVVMHAVIAGGYVIGEDLGTVEEEVRHAMAERHVAGTRVAWFDNSDPAHWPATSLATLTTHDLPTVCGALSGSDPATDPIMVDRMYAFAERGDGEDDGEVLVAAHDRLGRSNSSLALATLDDVVGSRLRVNLPGTVDQYPNWRLSLPVAVDQLHEHPLAERVVRTIGEARSQRHPDR